MKSVFFSPIVSLVILFAGATSVIASASDNFPDVLIGQTSLTTSEGKVYYGGFTGNEAIYNFTPYMPETMLGFYKDVLRSESATGCYSGLSLGESCYSLVVGSTPFNRSTFTLMESQTTIGNEAGTAAGLNIAALLQNPRIAVGDTYNMSDFAYWGRNLAEGGAADDDPANNRNATWKITGYTFNPEAQSTWLNGGREASGNTAIQNRYMEKTNILADEATKIMLAQLPLGAAGGSPNWHLQSSEAGEFGSQSGPGDDLIKSPEGKVWLLTNNSLGNTGLSAANITITYSGVGTLIIRGQLNIGNNVVIQPATDDSRLGIIVLDESIYSCKFGDNNRIEAAIFCAGTLKAGNTSAFTGSFVAKDFDVSSANNVRFTYDRDLGKQWPPGFRTLDMPQVEEK